LFVPSYNGKRQSETIFILGPLSERENERGEADRRTPIQGERERERERERKRERKSMASNDACTNVFDEVRKRKKTKIVFDRAWNAAAARAAFLINES
jgi:hypothetical protein